MLFVSLRRAEAARKRRVSQAGPEPDKPTIEPALPIEAARRVVDTGQLEGFPDSFLRELGVLKNSLESAFGASSKKTILFTSSTSAEGTTTIVSSYARLLSVQTNERVLLLEMNARKPALHWKFGLKSRFGVTQVLDGTRTLEAIVQPVLQGSFDVAHVGEGDPVKIQINLDQTFPVLLQAALRRYDTVLIDAPPVIGAPEVPPMTAAVDGVVMVVRAGRTKREVVQRSLELIGQFEGNVLGLVLNRKKYAIPDFIYRRL
jgi:succinoglycan biosynthesis transport protein ExoP